VAPLVCAGKSSVLVLDLSDNAAPRSGMVTRIFLSWPNTHRYPLGLLPGAKVVISFVSMTVSKATRKTYFRSTSLSSIEIIEPANQRTAR